MSEPLAEQLARFTPDGSGLDRDALLFAAGRASVRRKPGLVALTGVLAVSQLLMLLFLLQRPQDSSNPPQPGKPQTVATEPAPMPPSSVAAESYTVGLLSFDFDRFELPPTASEVNMIEASPPLYAFSATIPEWLR